MASTANSDKKRKKEKKNKNLQERPENDEFEGITKNKKKQRLQLPPTAVAAVREVEDRVMEKHSKKQKKKDKKKEKGERNRQDGGRPESAGDIVQEEKRNSRITDPRFSSAHFDPRFQRMPKRKSKVVIDSRFTRMFSDKNFSTSSAPLDKRGKARKEKAANPLLHYYLHKGEEGTEMKEEETDELREGSPELRRKASSSESEMEVSEEEEGEDFAASTSYESTSTSEEEDHDDDEVILLLPFICFNAAIYQISLIFHFSNFLISGSWLY